MNDNPVQIAGALFEAVQQARIAHLHAFVERFRAQAVNGFAVFGTQALASLLAGPALHLLGWTVMSRKGKRVPPPSSTSLRYRNNVSIRTPHGNPCWYSM